MATKQGHLGKVMAGASTIAHVDSWDLDISDEALETTGLGDTSRSFIGRGLYTCKGTVKFKAVDNSDTATAAIRAKILDNSSSITLKLYEDATKYWQTDAIVTGYPQTSTLDGLVTGSFSFQGTGALTYN